LARWPVISEIDISAHKFIEKRNQGPSVNLPLI